MIILGGFEGFGSGEVIGWVAEKDSDRIFTVDLLVDGRKVDRAVANFYRPDVEKAGIGDGRRGFHIRIPRLYFDDRPHTYEIRVEGVTIGSLGIKQARFRPNTRYQDRSVS